MEEEEEEASEEVRRRGLCHKKKKLCFTCGHGAAQTFAESVSSASGSLFASSGSI